MIPIKLEMHNFLPYRAPAILSFEGIHLACLTGANGAGKSSLLDAITWALWGKARATRDEDLIHQGQSRMWVSLDFAQEGVIYRVIRNRTSGKSGKSTLDLFAIQKDGQPRLINEGAIRQTQEKINNLLKLDYDTFVHSAFLQQGKADAFTTQTPAQRKRILSDILGLEQWAVYEERTKKKLKTLESNITETGGRIKQIDEDLLTRPALEVDLSDALLRCDNTQSLYDEAQTLFDQLRDVPGDLRRAREEHAVLQTRIGELERDLQESSTRVNTHRDKLTDYQTIIDQRAGIMAGVQALDSARALDDQLTEKLNALRTLDDERKELEKTLSNLQTELKSESKQLAKDIAEYRRIAEQDPSDALAGIEAELVQLAVIQSEQETLKDTETRLKEERAERTERFKTLEDEGKKLNARINTLETTTTEPLCPLCGQALNDEHRAQLLADITAERDARRQEWQSNKDALALCEASLKTVSKQVKDNEKTLKRLPELNAQAGQFRTQVQSAQTAAAQLTAAIQQQTALDQRLTAEDFGHEFRRQLAKIAKKSDELGYDKSTHENARVTLRDQQKVLSLQAHLQIAEESLPLEQTALESELARAQRLQTTIEERTAELTAQAHEITRLTTLLEEHNQREREMRQRHTELNEANERRNKISQSLSALDTQAKRKEQLEARLEVLRHEEGIYQELRRAFGKNGIPAMVIESAIPELESTANELLSRMTDGRMNLRLLTQRDNVTGGVRETLDIEIADELGTRQYELYSGGEAFRINFALRVALSQLLARRAGAHLRTLFIDEGFGTQDDAGREKLVEAINAIQDHFDLILVITHIDDLRDSFPVHIVVDKTREGSVIAVR